jgi:hypothetical protein
MAESRITDATLLPKERGLRLRYNCSELDLLADTLEVLA